MHFAELHVSLGECDQWEYKRNPQRGSKNNSENICNHNQLGEKL